MNSDTTNIIGNTNIINMLSLWLAPDMWQDKALFAEIKGIIQKLTEPSYQLSERELFLIQELTNGVLEATLASFNKADGSLKDELSLTLNDMTKFQSFLESCADVH